MRYRKVFIMNYETQYYRGLPLKLINRKDYKVRKAKRYTINNTNQNILDSKQILIR